MIRVDEMCTDVSQHSADVLCLALALHQLGAFTTAMMPPLHQVFEGRVIEGDGKSVGNVITACAGSGSSKQTYNYSTERVVGNGSFGVVFQATCLETAETVSRWTMQQQMPIYVLVGAANLHKCTVAVLLQSL